MKRKKVIVELGKLKYTIKFSPKLHATLHGECDVDAHKIVINATTPNDQVPEILIHECLHAIFPFLDEDCVGNAAIELSNMLKKMDMFCEEVTCTSRTL